MANGVPVRLSESLTASARSAAEIQERSLTEQVEHWARLGQVVEAAVSAGTLARLKARSHDADLEARLAVVDTAEGQRAARELIASRNPVRYGTDASGKLVKRVSKARRSTK